MTKTAMIFVHDSPDDPGLFGQILRERNFFTRVINTASESIKGIDVLKPDLLMVTGGKMGVYEADQYAFLHDELAALKARLTADKPTFGICLGSQLMAAALGQEVFKGKNNAEFGWYGIDLTKEAENHPIRHLAGDKTYIFQSHQDTFGQPEGTVLLASSPQYRSQAYSYGRNALGVQFHPEVTKEILSDWLPADSWLPHLAQKHGREWHPKMLEEETAKNIGILNRQSRFFFEEWLDSVGL